jgi:hypothetical protein
MESVIAAAVSGGLALIGVVATILANGRSVTLKIEKAQAVTDTKIEELTREVREHNGFARRLPVCEEQIRVLGREVKELKDERKNAK